MGRKSAGPDRGKAGAALLPCPFCGKLPEVGRTCSGVTTWVACRTCDINRDDEADWNRRVSVQQMRAIEMLGELLAYEEWQAHVGGVVPERFIGVINRAIEAYRAALAPEAAAPVDVNETPKDEHQAGLMSSGLTQAQQPSALPPGHQVLEQTTLPDGRVSLTVQVCGGYDYTRIIHADEARPQPARWPAPWPTRGDVQEIAENGDGFWRSCSGCHELNEGYPTGPYHPVLKCPVGLGCSECGGIGAIWDTTDYAAMGDWLAKELVNEVDQQQPALPPEIAELHLLEEVCAFYANDEDRFLKNEGEPYGSIPTEVGLKARAARQRFLDREKADATRGASEDRADG